MNGVAGRLVETRRRFQAALAASHQPARSPTRLSVDGAPFCAASDEATRTNDARAARLRSCWLTVLFSGRGGADERTAASPHRQRGQRPRRGPASFTILPPRSTFTRTLSPARSPLR